jgi:assimilatory nitrate reductase catalytic subunit
MTRTGLSAKLLAHFDAPFAQLNPQSSRELAVEDGDLVEISSLNGSIVVPVRYDSGIRPGEVFVPIHWSDQFTSNAGVGKIISARVDSISGQPETKLEAVALKAVTMLCWISFCSIREIDVKSFDYWHKLPLKKGFRYLMAMKPSEVFNLKFWIQSEFPESDLIEFIDEDQHDHRIACFEKGKLAAIAYSAKSHRSLPAPNWLNDILKSKQHSNSWQLLAGKALNQKDVGKLICSCYEVGENQIIDAVLAGCVDHEELGGILRCGTNCGSCIPELMQLVKQYQSSVVQICSVNQND